MLFFQSSPRKLHHRRIDAAPWLAAVFLVGSALFSPSGAGAENRSDKGADIEFSTGIWEATFRSKVSGKPIVVVFTAEWCPVCRKMRATLFKDQEGVNALREFEWVAIDIDRQPSVARAYDVKTIPQFHIIDAEGNRWAVISGITDAPMLKNQLEEIGERIRAGKKGGPLASPTRLEGNKSVDIIVLPDEYRAKSICYANVGYGPLELPSQSPLQGLRLGLAPRTPSTLLKGQKDLRARGTWVNIWADEADYQFDYETLQTNVTLGYGLTDTLQIEGGISVQSHFGGVMDSFIQEFHDLFNIDQNGRDQVPKGRFALDIFPTATQPGVSLSSSDRGIYSSSAEVTLQHNVTCGTLSLPAFAYGLTVHYEIQSDDLEGGSPFDLGGSVALSRRYDQVYLYGTIGFTLFGRERFRGIDLRNSQFSFLAALEWRAFSTASLLVQYLATEGLTDAPRDLSKFSHEITLGAKWEIIKGTVLEFGLIENIITYGNSPDFGLHLGVTTRF